MATTKSKAKAAAKVEPKNRNINALKINDYPKKSDSQIFAEDCISPVIIGAITMEAFKDTFAHVSLYELIHATDEQVKAIVGGDMKRVEGMLVAQAHTLDAIFNELARRAALNMGVHINAMDIYLRLALKAQSQCRTTLEALAEIKNPQPTAFIRQQNISVNQQVNNDAVPLAHGKIKNQPNELLTEGVHHGTTLDTGRTGKAIGTNQELEAVGTVNRR